MSADDDCFGSLPPSEQWRLPERGDTEPTTARWLAPPAEAFIPAEDPQYIQLGWGQTPEGSWAPVGLRQDDLRFGAWLTGTMGAGKSETLKRLCRQFITARSGFLALDCKGLDPITDIIPLVPREREGTVAIFDLEGMLLNGEQLIPALNLLAPAVGTTPDLQGRALLACFVALDPWAAQHPAVLRLVSLALQALHAGEEYPTLWHLQRFLTSTVYRLRICQSCTDAQLSNFWRHWSPAQMGLPEEQFLRALAWLLDHPILAPLLAAPACALPVRALMDQGGILLGGISAYEREVAQIGSVALLVQVLLADQCRATAAAQEEPAAWPDFHLLIDEAQMVLNDNPELVRMLFPRDEQPEAEPRLGVVVSHQIQSQLDDGALRALRRVPCRVILGAAREDARQYAREEGALGLSEADFRNQEKHKHQRLTLPGLDTLCSARVLGRARPLEEPAPEPVEQDWRTISAPSQTEEDRQLDEAIRHVRELATQSPAEAIRHLGRIARADPARFTRYGERTRAHRQVQRAFLLANPGAIPDKRERIRTLSALWVGVPLLEVRALQWALANPSTVREG
jgi:hypothetical protein